MKKYLFSIIALLLMVAEACSGGSGAKSRRLTVSIEPQRYLLESIAGDRWQVGTLLEKGSDPENFDPTVMQLRDVASSQAYFSVGTMEFEKAVAERVASDGSGVKIVDTSRGIPRLQGTHTHEHSDGSTHTHTAADPHIWSSLPNAIRMASNMLDALIELDPEGEAYYRANYDSLASHITALHDSITTQVAASPRRSFLIWHPSLSYFARDYGLEQIALGATNRELTPVALKQNIDRARQSDSIVMFIQADYDYNRSAEVARQADARTVEINLLDYDLPGQLAAVAKEITR